jgi:ABC-2 type transport system permease protein
MRVDMIRVIARREYVSRVKTKGFWIGTVALPVFILAMAVLPALVMTKAKTVHRMVVVDQTGALGADLVRRLNERSAEGRKAVGFEATLQPADGNVEARKAELDREVMAGTIDSWAWIAPEDLDDGRVEYHAENVSNFATQEVLEDALSNVVRRHRLQEAGYDPDQIQGLEGSMKLNTVRVSESGSREEGAAASFILAYVLFLLLYMVLIIYGQQVMQGVIEEKTSRVVEVVVSSVRPFELMMGKLIGICLTALTQLAVWLGTVAVVTLPAVAASFAWLPPDLKLPTLPLAVVGHFFILFFLGFFLFASFYAAIGAAFNNLQEASQLSTFAIMFLVAPFMFMMPVINDPDSTLAVVLSMIPTFTPLLMMLRIAVKMPPWWQIVVAYALTGAFTVFMIWMAGRIYRIGILMYGKKPTPKEILRWVRVS